MYKPSFSTNALWPHWLVDYRKGIQPQQFTIVGGQLKQE